MENEQYMKKGKSILFEGLRMILFPQSNKNIRLTEEQTVQVKNAMNSCIETAFHEVEKLKDELPKVNDGLHQRIADLLSYTQCKANSYVKEG